MVSLRLLNRRRTLHQAGSSTATEPVKIPESEQDRAAEAKRRGWWDLLPFPTHRIPIAGDLWTNNQGVQAGDDVRTAILLRYCGGSFEGKTIADLGCLEAHSPSSSPVEERNTRSGSRRGRSISSGANSFASSWSCRISSSFKRTSRKNFRNGSNDWTRFSWPVSSTTSPIRSRCSAIHRATRDLVLIDTHVAHPEETSHGCSELVTRSWEGYNYRGRIFREYTPDISKTAHEKLIWAAWSDETAFWLLEQDLLQMCKDVGFSSVEKVDPTHYGSNWYVDQSNRTLVVCRK